MTYMIGPTENLRFDESALNCGSVMLQLPKAVDLASKLSSISVESEMDISISPYSQNSVGDVKSITKKLHSSVNLENIR